MNQRNVASVIPTPWNPDANVSHDDIDHLVHARRITQALSPDNTFFEVQSGLLTRPDDEISVYTRRNRGYSTAAKRLQQDKPKEEWPRGSLKENSDLNGIGSRFKPAGQQTVVEIMADCIERSLVPYSGNKDGSSWLPVSELYRIVNQESVYEALIHTLKSENVEITEVRGYAAKVCGITEYIDRNGRLSSSGARSMFAILALINKVEEIKKFVDSGFTDEDLPLVHSFERNRHQLSPKCLTIGELDCWTIGQTWEPNDWRAFKLCQDAMRSPFFELRQKNNMLPHYDLDPGTVLPFVRDFGKSATVLGGFSTVRRVQIHPAHHDEDCSQGDHSFAVKELQYNSDTLDSKRELDFKEEVRSWAKSAGVSKHPHLIRLLATWRQNSTWCLLFPWANSNLKEFWFSKTPGRRPEFVKWVSKQCLGLAEGLRSIHKSRSDPTREWGIHGDVKPQNILWFNDPEDKYGILIISDFGLTRFHGEETRSNAHAPGLDPTYQAPEYEFSNGISRAADIWALGCVYLEFVTWYLTGKTGLENSIQRRIQDDRGHIRSMRQDKFFNLKPTKNGGNGAELKESITSLIKELRQNQYCNSYFEGLLDLIESRLLCTESRDREKCDRLVIRLRELDQSLRDITTDEVMVAEQGDHIPVSEPTPNLFLHLKGPQSLPESSCASSPDQQINFRTWAPSTNGSSYLSDREIRTIQVIGSLDAKLPKNNSSDAKAGEHASDTIDRAENKLSKRFIAESEQASLSFLLEPPCQLSDNSTTASSS